MSGPHSNIYLSSDRKEFLLTFPDGNWKAGIYLLKITCSVDDQINLGNKIDFRTGFKTFFVSEVGPDCGNNSFITGQVESGQSHNLDG